MTDYSALPAPVLAKLLSLEESVDFFAQRVAKTQAGIESARHRLSGGFHKDSEYRDTRHALDQLIADEPVLKQKLGAAKLVLVRCKAFIEELPEGTALEAVDVKTDDKTLEEVRARIKELEAELAAAAAAPTSDIEERIRNYVESMAKPTITGVGRGERLKVLWPGCGFGPSGPREDRAEVLPMMALLFPDAMVKALISAIDLTSTAACPDVLIDQLDQLAYIEEILVAAAIADGRDAQRRASAPPAAVLGVRVAEKVQRAA